MQYQKQQSQVISNKTLKNVRKNEKKRKKIQIRFQISKRYRKKMFSLLSSSRKPKVGNWRILTNSEESSSFQKNLIKGLKILVES